MALSPNLFEVERAFERFVCLAEFHKHVLDWENEMEPVFFHAKATSQGFGDIESEEGWDRVSRVESLASAEEVVVFGGGVVASIGGSVPMGGSVSGVSSRSWADFAEEVGDDQELDAASSVGGSVPTD